MRIDVKELPLAMREQVAIKMAGRLAQAVPVAAAAAPQTQESGKEDPCETCLRWPECNGVDEECPMR